MALSKKESILYGVFATPKEARAIAKSLAQRFEIFTEVEGRSVFLTVEHQNSGRHEGFKKAWEEGERLRGTWSEEDQQASDHRGDFEKSKQAEYAQNDEDAYREELLERSRNDPPYKLRE
jgi:hypothetical protein